MTENKEPVYFWIDEVLAELAQHMNSFSPYVKGSETAGYREEVARAYAAAKNKAAEFPACSEKAFRLAESFSKKYADWANERNRIETMEPSILVAGPGGVNNRRKARQNERRHVSSQKYREIMKIIERIEDLQPPRVISEEEKAEKAARWQGWDFAGGKVVINTEENRVQILYDDKPDEETRQALKKHAFRWAPSKKAWQRQLTENGVYAAKVVTSSL